MNIKPIRTEKNYNEAIKRIEEIWGNPLGSPQGDELEILATLIDKYEEEHFPIKAPDAVEAIKYIMEEKGLERKDLIKLLGSKSKVSDVLIRKRDLSKRMIKMLHEHLGIPYDILMA